MGDEVPTRQSNNSAAQGTRRRDAPILPSPAALCKPPLCQVSCTGWMDQSREKLSVVKGLFDSPCWSRRNILSRTDSRHSRDTRYMSSNSTVGLKGPTG